MSDAIYVTVALIWLVPDRRIERFVRAHAGAEPAQSPELIAPMPEL